jgi:Holliday junction resolvasome RuvABC endonuclease subunit
VIIAGFDLSTKKIAVVWSNGGDLTQERTYTWNYPAPYQAAEAYSAVERWIWEIGQHDRMLCYLEAPYINPGRLKGMLSQAYVHGAVQAALASAEAVLNLVPVATWKKRIVGSGKAKKPDVVEYLRQRGGYENILSDQDLCDAACVHLYGVLIEEG